MEANKKHSISTKSKHLKTLANVWGLLLSLVSIPKKEIKNQSCKQMHSANYLSSKRLSTMASGATNTDGVITHTGFSVLTGKRRA